MKQYHKSQKFTFCHLLTGFCLNRPFYPSFPHFQQRRAIFARLFVQRGSSLFPRTQTDTLTALMGGKQRDTSRQRSTDGDICHRLCHNKRLYMRVHAFARTFFRF